MNQSARLVAVCLAFLAIVGVGQPLSPDRIFTQQTGGLSVRAGVPSADETEELFGVDLYRRGVQPVWLEIANHGQAPVWFLPASVDAEYFTAGEVADRLSRREQRRWQPQGAAPAASGIRLRIEPGETRSAYVYTPVDEGTKTFNVDVIGEREWLSANFFIPVPGLRIDHYDVDWASLYPESDLVELDRTGLIARLEDLPCCVRDSRDRTDGDPLNIALIGSAGDIYRALMRAGWDETETIYGRSLWRTLRSAVTGSNYRYSPVSALYAFGRAQDVAFQKVRTSINERNHLRLWLTPWRYQGRSVWIGQISRDIGVRFTRKTITTHKIDPAVDETREFLIEDLAYAQALAGIGYVEGVGAAAIDSPRGNLTGDPYFTDGLRAVFLLAEEPVSINEIEFLELGSSP